VSGCYTYDLIERVNNATKLEGKIIRKASDHHDTTQERKTNEEIPHIPPKDNSDRSAIDSMNLIIYIMLRSLVLIPIYIIVYFFLKQYSKERDIEENYAHKQTVSATLKTYGELLRDSVAKDSIAINASEVIYSSPNQQLQKIKKDKPEATESLVEKITENIISKLSRTNPRQNVR
jgi:hypothetical protein